jgi:hypothetical protein
MPAAAVASLAKKAGVSVKAAEKAWAKIKKAVVGAKLRSGATIPADSDEWTSEMWAYVMGSFKNAVKGMGESLIEQVLEGDTPSAAIDRVERFGKWYASEMERLGREIAKQSGEVPFDESKG